MKVKISLVVAIAIALPTGALAGLELPNGKVVFEDETKQNSSETHPSLTKRSATGAASSGSVGAWEAHRNSDKIDYQSD